MLPLIFGLYFLVGGFGGAAFVLGAALGGILESSMGETGVILGLLIGAIGFFTCCVLGMLGMYIIGPPIQVAILRAEITGELGSAFAIGNVLRDTKLNFKPLLIGGIVVGLGSMVLLTLGYMMCFIGMYPAFFLMIAAASELRTEVYRRHLSLGHEAIAEISFVDGESLVPTV
jgi:hypothetical protein